jgi:hypothetical protein
MNWFCGCHEKDRRYKALAYSCSDTMLVNGEKQKTGKGRERREEHNVSKRTTSLLITLHYFDYKVGKYIDLRKGKDQSTKRETKG